MTNEDIFREVDEEVRREQLKVYWEKFGIYIIGCAATIIIIVAGYVGWQEWNKERSERAGAEYLYANQLISENKNDDAAKSFAKLINDGPAGYRVLSSIQLAFTHAKNGKHEDAVRVFDKLASDKAADRVLQGFAKIQAAMLLLDKSDHAEMEKRLKDMTKADNYWRHSARDLLGLSAYKAGKLKQAAEFYDQIARDSGAPAQMRERANMMRSVIDAALIQQKKHGVQESE